MDSTVATNRWRGVVALALAAGALGVLARRPSLLLVAVPGLVFAAYARTTAVGPVDLELTRRMGGATWRPGDEVEVEVTVRNAGSARLWDLRVVDGVPPALAVVDGSPRHGGVLGPGEATSFTYTVDARLGRHRFEPMTAVVRDLSGATEYTTTVADETELVCRPAAAALAPRATNRDAGPFTGRRRGMGVEFSHVRDYRHGDAARRIDWNRYARDRVLTTVSYRQQRALTVVAVVDARRPSYRGLEDGPDAIAAGVTTVEVLANGLVDGRNRVGVAALGWPDAWLPPATGRDHLAAIRGFLAGQRAFGVTPPDDEPSVGVQVDRLAVRLPTDATCWLLSPLCDDGAVEAARRLEAIGHPVTVVAPDVTARDTPGRRLAAIERELRVAGLRRSGIPVVEWSLAEPLAAAVARQGEVRLA